MLKSSMFKSSKILKILNDLSSKSSIVESEKKNCEVCTNLSMKIYKCPRCLAFVCSSKCYSMHNTDCTEVFYREKVQTILTLEKENEKESLEDTISSDSIETQLNSEQIEGLNELAEKLMENEMDTSILDFEEMKLLRSVLKDFLKSNKLSVGAFPSWWGYSSRIMTEEIDTRGISNNESSKNAESIFSSKADKNDLSNKQQPVDTNHLFNDTTASETLSMNICQNIPKFTAEINKIRIVFDDLVSNSNQNISDEFLYQSVGFLLGYTLMMRSVGRVHIYYTIR